ncbi:hypothetical protein L0244_19305, partial [bacterium]|nr:hypothetical protein [bacterium]
RETLSTENTAMIVSFDLTDGDVHPVNKKPIAIRLALAAKALAYDERIEYSVPLYSNVFYKKGKIIIDFSHAEDLISCDGEPLHDFELMDASGSFNPVEPEIEDGEIVIPVHDLKGPFIVRYAYKDYPLGNLCNQANLPASPFVTEVISSF